MITKKMAKCDVCNTWQLCCWLPISRFWQCADTRACSERWVANGCPLNVYDRISRLQDADTQKPRR